ncbi:MAG: hypothetical protein C0519_16160 [Hyphomicrobium sp.]|nr:hypothetical protein [Hyphomicrobium sp.]PPD05820.1 MAG: hypothetical protein CTY28_16025 [Hyphomicrobium sp.]
MTAEEIVKKANRLARIFYQMQGYEVSDDFKFYRAHHPAEVGCWNMAVVAFDEIEGTDVEDCLAQLEEDEAA